MQFFLVWRAGHLDPGDLKDHLSEIGFGEIEHLRNRLPHLRKCDRVRGVLSGWRDRLAERRRFAERREPARAAEAAIAASRDREATDQVLAVNRLINAASVPGAAGMRAKNTRTNGRPDVGPRAGFARFTVVRYRTPGASE